jgi:hypothetical protein
MSCYGTYFRVRPKTIDVTAMANRETAAQARASAALRKGPGIYHAILPDFERPKITVLMNFPAIAYYF